MSERLLIVIPARGGSKGIPRKNIRLLAGRPLLTYAIETSKQLHNADVVVSTEDEEIAEIASNHGVQIVFRPARLATDDATVAEVVQHAWLEMERRAGRSFSIVVTVQPTSPLVTPDTIAKVVGRLRAGADCCLTVKDARHLYWMERDGEPVPAYKERKNRQWLPPFWQETGAVFATKRHLVASGHLVGGKVALYPLPVEESIDIDSWEDWVVAEARLLSPKVVMRVIGSRLTGLGHAYRALTLANRLVVPKLHFAVDRDSTLAAELIAASNYPITVVNDDASFIDLVAKSDFDLVINDVLDTRREYIEALKSDGKRFVVNFEDLGDGAEVAHLVINDMYEYSTPLPTHRYGWKYACLRDEFLATPPPSKWGINNVVLIAFGGTDPNDLTSRTLSAIEQLSHEIPDLRLIIVVGPGNHRRKAYENQIERLRSSGVHAELHHAVKRMSRLMAQATVAVTSNGRTVFELASLGIPMITISQNQREATHTFGRLSGGVMDLGIERFVDESTLYGALQELLLDRTKLLDMRKRLLRFDLRSGTNRVIDEILTLYRQWRSKCS